MSAFATFGGPIGLAIGGGYFVLDIIASNKVYMPTTAIPFPQTAIDNTYVAPTLPLNFD